MANDCLVTKLKATVNNSNLKKLGVIKMRIVVGANAQINRMAENSTLGAQMKIKAYGDGYFTTTKGGNVRLGDEVTFSQEVFPVQGEYDIEVSYKYNAHDLVMLNVTVKDIDFSDFDYTELKNIGYFEDSTNVDYDKIPSKNFNNLVNLNFDTNRNGKLNIDNFANNTTLTILRINSVVNGQISGNISALSNNTALTKFDCKTSKITGDISALGGCTALTRTEIYQSKISGSIESLAAAQVAAGRTSGSLVVFYSAPVTYNGESPLDSAIKTIKFGSSMENPTSQETTQGWQIA